MSGIAGPLTYGLLRPVILLPQSLDWADQERLRHILAHEMAHIRHGDALWKPLLLAAACVHWFNPFVWAMFIFANRDMEIRCDAAVLRSLGREGRAAYAMTLVDLAQSPVRPRPLESALSKNAMEERTISIMKRKRISWIGIAAAIVLLAGGVAAIGVSALEGATPAHAAPLDVQSESGVDWGGREPIELSEHWVAVNAPSLEDLPLRTATGQIVVSLANDEGFDTGFFTLYRLDDPGEAAQTLTLDPDNQMKAFTDLSADATYRIAASDIDALAILMISAAPR